MVDYLKLAKKAGFITWSNEPWGRGPQYIDWASSYDDEIVKFGDLVIKEVLEDELPGLLNRLKFIANNIDNISKRDDCRHQLEVVITRLKDLNK